MAIIYSNLIHNEAIIAANIAALEQGSQDISHLLPREREREIDDKVLELRKYYPLPKCKTSCSKKYINTIWTSKTNSVIFLTIETNTNIPIMLLMSRNICFCVFI